MINLVGSREAADILCFRSSKGFSMLLYETFSDVSIRNDLYKSFVSPIAECMGKLVQCSVGIGGLFSD